MLKLRASWPWFVLAAALACTSVAAAPLRVVATLVPIAYLVRDLGGDRVACDVLVPPGASPHTFEPRPSDAARVARAALVLRVGGGLDDWARPLAAGAPRELALFHGQRGENPHEWLDPIRVRDAWVPALARALSEADPAGAASYAAAEKRLAGELTALDAELRQTLSAAPSRAYVAFHAAWKPFADRYGLVEVGVVHAFAGAEPGPRELARLVAAARAAGVRAVLVEPQLDPRTAAALAAELGGRTVLVDPQGDPGDPERADYAKLMRWNARAFLRALGGPG